VKRIAVVDTRLIAYMTYHRKEDFLKTKMDLPMQQSLLNIIPVIKEMKELMCNARKGI